MCGETNVYAIFCKSKSRYAFLPLPVFYQSNASGTSKFHQSGIGTAMQMGTYDGATTIWRYRTFNNS